MMADIAEIERRFLVLPGVTSVQVIPRTGYDVFITLPEWNDETEQAVYAIERDLLRVTNDLVVSIHLGMEVNDDG